MKLNLSFRDILRTAKRHKVKLTPGACVSDYRIDGSGCVLTTLAVDNGVTAVYEMRDMLGPDVAVKLHALEAGFEGWSPEGGSFYREQLYKDNKVVYNRYEKIGRRLRKYAGY